MKIFWQGQSITMARKIQSFLPFMTFNPAGANEPTENRRIIFPSNAP
jgi:hypothetical protein